ncbi:hypothetical protein LCGC14_2565540 [marine sediment metagenome]|uniref:Class II aldolase/adducin N-terminal domain-containing protein n=1 Tax=marine sediment metagenome TaxID=412755 RepID=A0A0F9AIP4_9ZZZZ
MREPIRILIVAGRFDDKGGRPSGWARKTFATPGRQFYFQGDVWDYHNGGSWDDLLEIWTSSHFHEYSVIIWLADIPNDKPKLVNDIKKKNPHCLLVTSKNNLEDRYSHHEIVDRALKTRSNLLIELTIADNVWEATIWDALGNVYLQKEVDVDKVRQVLFSRLEKLSSFTRVKSIRVGDAIEVPDEKEFFELTRQYASTFHELIHAANPSRFLGNLSFRCENGFPSFRSGDKFFVSRRNIDKRQIGREGFVSVDLGDWSLAKCYVSETVPYYGDNKPSVDTPIQRLLFRQFNQINYMLHSHTYVDGAPFTDNVIPCGALEEYEAIVNQVCYSSGKMIIRDERQFAVNLRGHGSLVGAATVNQLRNISKTCTRIAA